MTRHHPDDAPFARRPAVSGRESPPPPGAALAMASATCGAAGCAAADREPVGQHAGVNHLLVRCIPGRDQVSTDPVGDLSGRGRWSVPEAERQIRVLEQRQLAAVCVRQKTLEYGLSATLRLVKSGSTKPPSRQLHGSQGFVIFFPPRLSGGMCSRWVAGVPQIGQSGKNFGWISSAAAALPIRSSEASSVNSANTAASVLQYRRPPPAGGGRGATAIDPSPMATAQRLIDPKRTSPAAKHRADSSPAAAAPSAAASRCLARGRHHCRFDQVPGGVGDQPEPPPTNSNLRPWHGS